jgi:hypothetical protein
VKPLVFGGEAAVGPTLIWVTHEKHAELLGVHFPGQDHATITRRTRLMKNIEEFIRRTKTDEDEMDRFVEVGT